MMNQALCKQDIDTFYSIRSFSLHELHLQIIIPYIEELKPAMQQEYLLPTVRLLYHRALVPNEKYNEIKNHVGRLISFNEFLSTGANREVVFVFAGKSNSGQLELYLDEVSLKYISIINDAS
jgi:hypothetical protein